MKILTKQEQIVVKQKQLEMLINSQDGHIQDLNHKIQNEERKIFNSHSLSHLLRNLRNAYEISDVLKEYYEILTPQKNS